MTKGSSFRLKQAFCFLIAGAVAVVILLPLYWGLLNSFKVNRELVRANSFAMPEKWLFSNYAEAWSAGVADYMLNSLFVTAVSVLLILTVASLAAYGFSRFNFPLREPLFYLMLGGLMVSEYCIIIPLYNQFVGLGLRDSHVALFIAYLTLQTPFATFLMRSYFLGLDKGIEEAAIIDGCSAFGVYARIILPLGKPIIFSSALISAVNCWNEFMFALVFIDSQSKMTIPLGLQTFQGQYANKWTVTLAACFICSAPLVIAFLAAQKQFVRGLAAGSIKG